MRIIIKILQGESGPFDSRNPSSRDGQGRRRPAQRYPNRPARSPGSRFVRNRLGPLMSPLLRGRQGAVSPAVAGRFAQRYGVGGILNRGRGMLGRTAGRVLSGPIGKIGGGLLGGALGALQLGSIFAGAGRRDAQIE